MASNGTILLSGIGIRKDMGEIRREILYIVSRTAAIESRKKDLIYLAGKLIISKGIKLLRLRINR